jgi:hypothetical protein
VRWVLSPFILDTSLTSAQVDDDDFEDVEPDAKKPKSSDGGKGKGRAGEPITVDDEEVTVEQVVPSTKMKHLGWVYSA